MADAGLLHPDLLRNIRRLGFEKATEIQDQAIPPALEGRDILACAATGSGKTAAFLLPTIQRILEGPRERKTKALVVTPTRELCAQVASDLREFAAKTRVKGAPVHGGVSMVPQVRAFKQNVDIIVATPGRLLDHLDHSTYCNLDDIEILILDEADRMLDMGFLPDIKRIIGYMPPVRQTLFFSATMPNEIRKLTQQILHNPVEISVERQAQPAEGVRQLAISVAQTNKSRLLFDILGRDEVKTVLCFTRTRMRANRVADLLEKNGVPAARIHGNRTQGQRQKALDAFKRGRVNILVATDVAARGIDIDSLSHVINYDVPGAPEDYIHRVGRTARANREGDAITFVAPQEERDFKLIEKALGKTIERGPTFGTVEAPPKHKKKTRGKGKSKYKDSGDSGPRSDNQGGDKPYPRRNSGGPKPRTSSGYRREDTNDRSERPRRDDRRSSDDRRPAGRPFAHSDGPRQRSDDRRPDDRRRDDRRPSDRRDDRPQGRDDRSERRDRNDRGGERRGPNDRFERNDRGGERRGPNEGRPFRNDRNNRNDDGPRDRRDREDQGRDRDSRGDNRGDDRGERRDRRERDDHPRDRRSGPKFGPQPGDKKKRKKVKTKPYKSKRKLREGDGGGPSGPKSDRKKDGDRSQSKGAKRPHKKKGGPGGGAKNAQRAS